MSRPPILDTIAIAAPCSASWETMTGDDRIRHCSECDRSVYNLSGMTVPEVVDLMAKNQGKLCGRIYRRRDGTLLGGDCPVGVRDRRQRRARAVASGTLLAGLLTLSGAAAAGWARFSRNPIPPIPSGPNRTLSAWSDWALQAIGLRRPPQYVLGEICIQPAPGVGAPVVNPPVADPGAPNADDQP